MTDTQTRQFEGHCDESEVNEVGRRNLKVSKSLLLTSQFHLFNAYLPYRPKTILAYILQVR